MRTIILRGFVLMALVLVREISFPQWMPVPVPTSAGFACITFSDSAHGYLCGGNILKSSDGGNNWSVVLPGYYTGFTDLSFPSVSTGYTVGDFGTVMKTTDGGSTWYNLNTGIWEILRGVYFLNPDTGFICGQGEQIFRTENGGLTWEQQNIGSYWLRRFSFPTQRVGYCVGDGKTIYKTSNGGETWNFISGWGSTDTNITDVTFLSPDTGYVCGLKGYIAKTVDGGLNWQVLDPGTSKFFEGIWFHNVMEGYVTGQEGTVLRTTDGGQTWTPEITGSDTTLRKIFFPSREIGFICGFNATLLTRDGTPVKEVTTPEILLYPNPCEDIFFILNPGRIVIQQLELFDRSGRKLFTSNIPLPREEKITVPVDLPNGLYLVRGVDDQGAAFMKKMAVVR